MDKDREVSYSKEELERARGVFFALLCFFERKTLCLFPEDLRTELHIRCMRQDLITVIDLIDDKV